MNQVVILAGGHGNRMKAAIPKPMLQVLDVPCWAGSSVPVRAQD